MRLISLALLLSALFIFTIPTHAANCDGLQLSGALSTGTYTMTDDCDISGTLTVAGSEIVTINGGGFTINGGGSSQIFFILVGGTLILDNVTLTNGYSIAPSGGGAISNSGTLTITNSTFSGNSNSNRGGAIANFVTATITNSTFSGNSATNLGGAIYNSRTLTIINSTFSGNAAGDGGAIFNFTGNTATITNSIISGNTSDNCSGTITDGGGNIENADTCGFADFPNTDPMLGTFNGAYFPLLDGSPAIDAAPGCAGLTADQIGNARPFGPACDSGAIEAEYIVTETGETEIIAPATEAPPMCNTITDISAPGLPDGVYCRVLMENGAWMTDAGTVPGNLALANPILAVDVFRITGASVTSNDFGGYVQVCLPGEGRMIFLDATQSPRPQVEITPVEFVNGSTCGWIPNAGTVILLPQ